ncbi:Potassium-transporting ATPase KdpC subunit, partial [Frankliniella fusca]
VNGKESRSIAHNSNCHWVRDESTTDISDLERNRIQVNKLQGVSSPAYRKVATSPALSSAPFRSGHQACVSIPSGSACTPLSSLADKLLEMSGLEISSSGSFHASSSASKGLYPSKSSGLRLWKSGHVCRRPGNCLEYTATGRNFLSTGHFWYSTAPTPYTGEPSHASTVSRSALKCIKVLRLDDQEKHRKTSVEPVGWGSLHLLTHLIPLEK